MARGAVPVAGRSARRARARRGRSGDGKTSRRRGDESQIKKRSEPPHVGSYIRSVLPDGDGAARHPYLKWDGAARRPCHPNSLSRRQMRR
jgi:hypothetical protein